MIYKIIFFSVLTALNTFAFRLSPLSNSIYIGKSKNTVVYQVTNNSDAPMAIEASIVKREMNENGKENLPKTKKDMFIVYPNQLILKPKEKRGIKVTYLGPKNIPSELSYRIKIEQLPIDFDKKSKTGIKILMKYLGALYVTKEEFKHQIVLKEIVEKENHYLFKVANEGKSHKLLKRLKISVGEKDFIESDKLKNFSGENILSQSIRRFSVKKDLFKKRPSASGVKLLYE